MCVCVLSHFSDVWLFATPWTIAHRLLCPWDPPDQNTGVGCHTLLQGISQWSNLCLLCLLRWQAGSLPLAPLGSQEVMVHICNGKLLSHKKEHMWVSSNEVDEPRAYYTERSKSGKERQISYINAYIWNLERWYQRSYVQGSKETQRIDFQTQWEKERVGWFERTALKHIRYHM